MRLPMHARTAWRRSRPPSRRALTGWIRPRSRPRCWGGRVTAAHTVLLDVLEREHLLLQQLLGLAERQREALLVNDVAVLGTLAGELELALAAIEALERERGEEVARITAAETPAALTLSELLPLLDPESRAVLSGLRDGMRETASRVR